MLHQIKRCSAPCTGLIGLEDYQALVDQAGAFLRGKSRAVMGRMPQEMEAASDDLEFERAARLRDRIRALASVAQESQINPRRWTRPTSSPCFAEGGQACVQVFFFRAGQNWGNRAYFPRVDKSDEDRDVEAA
jgi:excinuclease ABC subunit C